MFKCRKEENYLEVFLKTPCIWSYVAYDTFEWVCKLRTAFPDIIMMNIDKNSSAAAKNHSDKNRSAIDR